MPAVTDDETHLELRFEVRPHDRVIVEARMHSEAFSREFSRSAPRTELFLWLAEEIRKRNIPASADIPQFATPAKA